jgi:hypothetical protein
MPHTMVIMPPCYAPAELESSGTGASSPASVIRSQVGVVIDTIIRDQGPPEAERDRLRAAAARGRVGEIGHGSHGHITPSPQKGPKKTLRCFFIAFELSIVLCSPCSTSSGNRCADTSHGRCVMGQRQPLGLLRLSSPIGTLIQCRRHCKEHGGERSAQRA